MRKHLASVEAGYGRGFPSSALRVTKRLVTAGFEEVRGAHLVTAIGDDTRKVCRPIDPDRV